MTHQSQKLGAHPLDFIEWRQILHGHDDGFDRPVGGLNGRCVDQCPDAAPVRNRKHNFLGSHCFTASEMDREWKLAERTLPPVGTPAGDDVQQRFHRMFRHAKAIHNPPGFTIDPFWPAIFGGEDDDAYRGGLNQRLKIGPGTPFVPVDARIDNCGRGLRCEQCQHLFVLGVERPASRFFRKEKVADMHVAVTHRRTLERPGEYRGRFKTKRPDVACEVVEAERSRQVSKVVDQTQTVRPSHQLLLFLGCEAGNDVVLVCTGFIGRDDDAVSGTGERAGACYDFRQYGVEVKTGADPQQGSDKGGGSSLRGFLFGAGVFGLCHRSYAPVRDSTLFCRVRSTSTPASFPRQSSNINYNNMLFDTVHT